MNFHANDDKMKPIHEDDYESSDKWRYSLYSAIIFLIIYSPYAYIR